jgi:hypothetical protein
MQYSQSIAICDMALHGNTMADVYLQAVGSNWAIDTYDIYMLYGHGHLDLAGVSSAVAAFCVLRCEPLCLLLVATIIAATTRPFAWCMAHPPTPTRATTDHAGRGPRGPNKSNELQQGRWVPACNLVQWLLFVETSAPWEPGGPGMCEVRCTGSMT